MKSKTNKISVNNKVNINDSNEYPLYIKKFILYYNSLSDKEKFKVNIMFGLSPTAIYISDVSKKYISSEISVDIKKFISYYNSLSGEQKFKINTMFNISSKATLIYLQQNNCDENLEGQKRR